jgi:hypothetical protein
MQGASAPCITSVTFAAPQHAALQIQRKPPRLCGAILRPWLHGFPARLYAAPHGFSVQYFLDKAMAEPILIG